MFNHINLEGIIVILPSSSDMTILAALVATEHRVNYNRILALVTVNHQSPCNCKVCGCLWSKWSQNIYINLMFLYISVVLNAVINTSNSSSSTHRFTLLACCRAGVNPRDIGFWIDAAVVNGISVYFWFWSPWPHLWEMVKWVSVYWSNSSSQCCLQETKSQGLLSCGAVVTLCQARPGWQRDGWRRANPLV